MDKRVHCRLDVDPMAATLSSHPATLHNIWVFGAVMSLPERDPGKSEHVYGQTQFRYGTIGDRPEEPAASKLSMVDGYDVRSILPVLSCQLIEKTSESFGPSDAKTNIRNFTFFKFMREFFTTIDRLPTVPQNE
jgi:hypothetical protein